MTETKPMTAEELLVKAPPDKRSELVRGRLVVREPAGARHGAVAARLAFLLIQHVEERALGRVYAAETGFHIDSSPDTVRAPDVAFVSRDRLPDQDSMGFPKFAPDLAVEVLSPNAQPGEILRKVGDWLNAGARLVWVVDPAASTTRYRADGTMTQVETGGRLDGEDVIPGFNCECRW